MRLATLALTALLLATCLPPTVVRSTAAQEMHSRCCTALQHATSTMRPPPRQLC